MKVDLSKLNFELEKYGKCWIHSDLKHSIITVHVEDAKDINKIEQICKKYFKHVNVINTPKPSEPELDIMKELKDTKKLLSLIETSINALTKRIEEIENEKASTQNTTKQTSHLRRKKK